jgi:hypothetical protein
MTTTEISPNAGAVTPDQHIFAALDRYRASYDAYAEFAVFDIGGTAEDTPEEAAAIAAMDAAEEEVRGSLASTPKGVEAKLWLALRAKELAFADSAAAVAGDLAYFVAKESSFDWPIRMLISAIVSLRAMSETEYTPNAATH